MKSRWSDHEAEHLIHRYAAQGVTEDVALRVYTSRLLGSDPELVLHGGGNTSVKTSLPDLVGDPIQVICVKGSGWDLESIEPAGLPAVRLEPLRALRRLDGLSDEAMVNAQRTNLLDATSPTPSVETLLHAFLPHKYIDHTHANAILSLTDQAEGEALCREVFGARVGYVPYIMPGFVLAKRAAEIFEGTPEVEGLLLLKHGLFTFGDTARESYDRMIALVDRAEVAIRERAHRTFAPREIDEPLAPVGRVAPIMRGLTAAPSGDAYLPFVLEFRTNSSILAFVNGSDLARYSQQGTITPDHVIRTKAKPLLVPPPVAGDLAAFREAAEKAIQVYVERYRAYFDRQNVRQEVPKQQLDPLPRVVLVPGLGLFGLGRTRKAARITADLAEANVAVITDAESIGIYEVLNESDTFDIEYWSLEQAKLASARTPALAGRVVVVTGAGSGIGAATARRFALEGAEVVVVDRDPEAAMAVAQGCGGEWKVCDVTVEEEVRTCFQEVAGSVGGVDIVVSNAGAAWQGRIGEVDDRALRASFELNFFAHQSVARAAVDIMVNQGIGGCLLFNASKQAMNPGKQFGPYGIPKAATISLMKQYAVDYGEEGIRANAVNADRIRTNLLTEAMIRSRAEQRGVTEEAYMAGNLLGREVTADDVAQMFLHLAVATKTTGAVITVDGGNIAAAPR